MIHPTTSHPPPAECGIPAGLVRHRAPHAPAPDLRTRRAHLIGIGGSGMSSLAAVLLGQGWSITGSDADPASARALQPLGARTAPDPSQLAAAGLVVHSSAVPPDHPERRLARRLGIPQLDYPRMLGRLMREADVGLAVAGTHGKSTTTALAAAILDEAGIDPTVVCGAVPLDQPTGGRPGSPATLLAEACEYRRNFLHLRPTLAAVLNIEPDHFDCYPSTSELLAAFRAFAARVRPGGVLLAHESCAPRLRHAAARLHTFGLGPACDWRAHPLARRAGAYAFDLYHRHLRLTRVRLRLPGRHNLQNALAAAALAAEMGVPAHHIRRGLERFPGLRRRLELVAPAPATRRGVTLIDDYAHHPTEVSASLAALRHQFPGRRLWCIFQPHQASRLRKLPRRFAASLQRADRILVAPVYRAREPRADAEDRALARRLARRAALAGTPALAFSQPAAILDHLAAALDAGDVAVTMGAGDIGKIAHELAQRV